MVLTVSLVLMIVAIILFVIAGLGVQVPRAQVGWFGLACVTLALILT